jgi:hypothetical protein
VVIQSGPPVRMQAPNLDVGRAPQHSGATVPATGAAR